MSDHVAFILAAYLAALVVLGGLTISSLSARNKTQRELEVRGLDRPREPSAKAS
jgi:heme exporter protein CcmD